MLLAIIALLIPPLPVPNAVLVALIVSTIAITRAHGASLRESLKKAINIIRVERRDVLLGLALFVGFLTPIVIYPAVMYPPNPQITVARLALFFVYYIVLLPFLVIDEEISGGEIRGSFGHTSISAVPSAVYYVLSRTLLLAATAIISLTLTQLLLSSLFSLAPLTFYHIWAFVLAPEVFFLWNRRRLTSASFNSALLAGILIWLSPMTFIS